MGGVLIREGEVPAEPVSPARQEPRPPESGQRHNRINPRLCARKELTMADAIIDLVGPDELPMISSLYNQIFRPARDIESFRRRFRGRYNVLMLIARIDDNPVGFFIGFELKPDVFFAW